MRNEKFEKRNEKSAKKIIDTPSKSAAVVGMIPCEPTPTGMWSNSDCASCSRRGETSASVRLVRSSRTPQLMSNPTPPGETTASGSAVSNAATLPMAKP